MDRFYVWEFTLLTFMAGLILYDSEGYLSKMLCIHIAGIGTFDLHGQILCVSEGFFSVLLCVHIVGMGIFGLHGLILYVSEGLLS